MKLKLLIAFILGFALAFYLLAFNEKVFVETNTKLIMSPERFAEECRNICYYNVMGEPYPGSCESTQTN